MEKYSKNIVESIKKEVEDDGVPDQFTVEEFVGDIKHEPERHFVFIMPEDPEPEIEKELKESKIILRKFDRNWKDPAELFKNYFACGKCDYVAKKLRDLYRHLKTCKNLQKCDKYFLVSKSENVEECGMCDLKLDYNNCKTKHQDRDHWNGSRWHCSRCDYKTILKTNLRKHYQTHVKKFSCETCKQKFAAKREFNNHQQQYRHGIFASEPETKFECRSCMRSFATKKGLNNHGRQFHSKLKFHCDLCGKTFRTKNEIRLHIQTHFKVPCPICQRMFAKRFLKRHIKEHSITSKFKCDECEKVYVSMNILNNHKNAKHEINQVQCDLCSKIFKNKLLIRMHMKIHIKVPCPMCRKLSTKSNLKQHIKAVHLSGEKSLACNIRRCKQRFKNIKELKDHEKIHIGQGIYKCPKCNYQQKLFRHIKDHMKRMSHKI